MARALSCHLLIDLGWSVVTVDPERVNERAIAAWTGAAANTLGAMAIRRMDHVGVVVEDLDAAKAFFAELGMEPRGEGDVAGDWVDRVVGLEGVRVEFAMVATPDGHNKLELIKFREPAGGGGDANAPANALGIRHLTFAVDDIDDVISRLRGHGAELVGELENYEDTYLLCYLRGPEGIIVELAEAIG